MARIHDSELPVYPSTYFIHEIPRLCFVLMFEILFIICKEHPDPELILFFSVGGVAFVHVHDL